MTVTVVYQKTKVLPHLEYQCTALVGNTKLQDWKHLTSILPSYLHTMPAPCIVAVWISWVKWRYSPSASSNHPGDGVNFELFVTEAVLSMCFSTSLTSNTGINPLMSCRGQSRRLVVPSHSRNASAWSLLCFILYHDKQLALTLALQLKCCNRIKRNRLPPCIELFHLVTPRITRTKRDVKTGFLFPFANLTAFYVVIAFSKKFHIQTTPEHYMMLQKGRKEAVAA